MARSAVFGLVLLNCHAEFADLLAVGVAGQLGGLQGGFGGVDVDLRPLRVAAQLGAVKHHQAFAFGHAAWGMQSHNLARQRAVDGAVVSPQLSWGVDVVRPWEGQQAHPCKQPQQPQTGAATLNVLPAFAPDLELNIQRAHHKPDDLHQKQKDAQQLEKHQVNRHRNTQK